MSNPSKNLTYPLNPTEADEIRRQLAGQGRSRAAMIEERKAAKKKESLIQWLVNNHELVNGTPPSTTYFKEDMEKLPLATLLKIKAAWEERIENPPTDIKGVPRGHTNGTPRPRRG